MKTDSIQTRIFLIILLPCLALFFTACGGGGGSGGGGSSAAPSTPVTTTPTTTTTTTTTSTTSTTTTTMPASPYTFGGGQGTQAQPYILQTATDVLHIRDFPAAYFWVQTNINMVGTNFIPMQNFSGTIYGNNFTWSNFTINYTSVDNYDYASFAQTLSGSIVSLKLSNASITGNKYASAFAGEMTAAAQLSSCYMSGTVVSPLSGNGVNTGNGRPLWAFKLAASYVSGSFVSGVTYNGNSIIRVDY